MAISVGVYHIAIVAGLVCTAIALLSTAAVIIVIHQIPWNSHILLISSTSWAIFLYNIGFIISLAPHPTLLANIIGEIIRMFFGIALNSYCTLIVLDVLHLVYFRDIFDVMKHKKYIHSFVFLLCAPLPIAYLWCAMHNRPYMYVRFTYIGFRIFLVLVNLVATSTCIYLMKQRDSGNSDPSPEQKAIKVLTYRLIFYPLFEIIARVAGDWYQSTFSLA